MTYLTKTTLISGLVLAVLYTPMVIAPARALKWIKAFPRHVPTGWVLAAVDFVWIYWLLKDTPLGGFERFRHIFYAMVPITFGLVVCFMQDLLAPRALGGLFLLVPALLLDAARQSDSPARLVIVAIAYLIAIKGIFLVLSPYMLRKSMERFIPDEASCRRWGSAGLAVSVLLCVLGFTVYNAV